MKFLKLSVLVLPLLLAGCAPTVHLSPAKESNALACADVMVRLPDEVDGLTRRVTDAQSTAAWGEPTAVILRCGLPEATASSLRCITQGDVDWLVDETEAPSYRFITFGRNPATEVIVDSNKTVGVNVIDAISAVVVTQPSTVRCG